MKSNITAHQLVDTKGYGDFSKTFIQIRDFLSELEKNEAKPIDFPWGRWAWMFSLPYLDSHFINKITYYKDHHQIVALLTYESSFGDVYYVIKEGYEFLKETMLKQAIYTFNETNAFRFLIPDRDEEMKMIAEKNHLHQSEDAEHTYKMKLDSTLKFDLNDGFNVTSLADEYNLKKYGECLYKGFNHEGEYQFTEEEHRDRKISLSAPGIDLNRNIAVMSKEGMFVSYCGTWYKEGYANVLLEPVATIPTHRKQGFGKACIYEALNRAIEKGAKSATVGSSQIFYQKLGFTHFMTSHFWKLK